MPETLVMCEETCNGSLDRVDLAGVSWPNNSLHYAFEPGAHHMRENFRDAFDAWSLICPLRFYETNNLEQAEIRIFWIPLPGKLGNTIWYFRNKTLTRANARINSQGNWNEFNILRTIIHEIGHAIGLRHTKVSGAVMNCCQSSGEIFEKFSDVDIDAVQALYRNYSSSGNFIQSSWGNRGNFEVVAGHTNGAVYHLWRNNNDNRHIWSSPSVVTHLQSDTPGFYPNVSLIQSNFGRNLEMVAVDESGNLVHFSGTNWPSGNFIADHVRGNPAFIQTRFGNRGNWEVIVPYEFGGLKHFWRDNDDPDYRWHSIDPILKEFGIVDAVAFIQSDFGDFGNMELILRQGDKLYHTFRGGLGSNDWVTPVLFFEGASGMPGFIQRKGKVGNNFDLVTPLKNGGILHLCRDHNEPGFPWKIGAKLGANQQFTQASIIHTNFGGHEILGLVRHNNIIRLFHYWANEPNFEWTFQDVPSIQS